MAQVFDAEDLVQLGGGEQAAFQYRFAYRLAALGAGFADLVAGVVADIGGKKGDQTDGAEDIVFTLGLVGADPFDALLPQGAAAVGQQLQRFEQTLGYHRLHHVEL